MQPLDLDELPVAGALDRDVTADGIVFRRLPAWTRPQLVDPALALLVTMPAGVRLELRTDAESIELDVMLTTIQIGSRPATPPTFDLVADDVLHASAVASSSTTIVLEPETGGVQFVPGEPATVRFDDVPVGARLELWLPHGAVVELRAVRVTDGALVEPAPSGGRTWVHYGSSISHCLETAHPTETWPAVAARLGEADLLNLAVAGQCHLDQHVARTIRDLDCDLISVKAGINIVNGDTMRERTFVPAVNGFLDTVRDGHPDTPLVVATPITCPAAEDHPGPTLTTGNGPMRIFDRPAELAVGALTLRRIRELVGAIVETRRAAGDENLHLVDGPSLFGPDDVGDLPDGLHPNPAGYRRIGERFHSLVFTGEGPFAG